MYCAASGCPLNETTLDESSNGLELIISFIASTHQPEHVFTPSQLEQIYREIVAQVQKYKETREATRAVYGDEVVADQSDFGLVAAAQSEAENESDVFANQNQYDRHSALRQNEMAKDSWANGGYVQDRHLPPQNQSLESEHELDSSIQEYHQQLLGSKPLPFDAMSLHDEEEEELSRHHAAEHSPYVQVCFRELLSQTGFLGLRKKDRLHKLSSVLSRPLGCCYDEVRKCWAIADSANNRILLYPEGVTIESPKFVNPSTVCVLQPGKVLGVLSDTCLATYTYDNNEVAIIVESYGGAKIRCRGLACTPRGNLVTILKKNFNTSEAIIYDAAHPSRYGQVVGRVSFPGASASFCAMNGRRLVVTDLGNQTLTMLEFNEAETSASIKQTTPFKWGSKGEPNGGFDFVSGVQVDSDGWSIVADAGGRTVQLFDEDLKFVTRLGSDFPLPYTSAIAINNFNEVMFIGRKNNEVTLATLEPFSDLPSLMGSSSSFSHSTAPTTTNPARFGNALPTSTTGAAANPPNTTTSRFGDNKSAFPSRTFNGPAKSSSSFGSNISTFR